MMDTYSMHAGHTVPGVVTGKPIALGGSKGRNEATARGAVICAREAAAKIGLSLKGATVVVQGYGNAGSIAARLISDLGAKVIAVSDSSGGIQNAAGLDLAAVDAHKKKTGSVVGFAGATAVSNQAILEIPCDVLIPAALENQITAENAAKIKTKIVAEAANGPTTPEADEVLFANGAMVIPDILCNAGGVTVSYFEWVQDLNRDFWEEEEVNLRLEKKMVRAFNEVYDMAQAQKSHLRTGAYLLSVKRVADAMSVRGIYP
jgi:glutamate dehydrogenase/leucine dehydrogenase